LLDGGVIGIGLILNYYYGLKIGLSIIILSIPLYIIAWFFYRHYFYNSLHGMLVSSFFIDLLSPLQRQFNVPILLSAIMGGLFVGVGIGLMLKKETSTGGTDLLAQFISNATSLNVGILILIIDGFVITIGINTVGKQAFLFSIITVVVVGIATSILSKKPQRMRIS
jgi:uncharacterized membrane-anchored protein YitT (DUF2179 family)